MVVVQAIGALNLTPASFVKTVPSCVSRDLVLTLSVVIDLLENAIATYVSPTSTSKTNGTIL